MLYTYCLSGSLEWACEGIINIPHQCRRGNWGPERLSEQPKETQLIPVGLGLDPSKLAAEPMSWTTALLVSLCCFFFYRFFFSLLWTISKSLLNMWQYCFCFMFWFLTGRRVILELLSPTGDQTCVPCTGKWSLNHWTTRKVPLVSLWIRGPLQWPRCSGSWHA